MPESLRNEETLTPQIDNFVEAYWAGVDLEIYDRLVSIGVTHQEILSVSDRSTNSSDMANDMLSLANRSSFMPRILMREFGVDYDAQSKFSPNTLLKKAGVSFRERRAVLRNPAIGTYFYRKARRDGGATHEECMEALNIGISMKAYSILRSKSFSHDEVSSSSLQLLSRNE